MKKKDRFGIDTLPANKKVDGMIERRKLRADKNLTQKRGFSKYTYLSRYKWKNYNQRIFFQLTEIVKPRTTNLLLTDTLKMGRENTTAFSLFKNTDGFKLM